MVRLDYKATVVKQYHIVWSRLCKQEGARPASDFNMEFGMQFLEEAIKNHYKRLGESSRHRWLKAIYTLADFNRTGILSLRREKRNFVFAEPVRAAFQKYTDYQCAVGMSEAHRQDTCLYLERFSKYLEHQSLTDISELNDGLVLGYVNSLAIYQLPTIYHTVCVLRSTLRYLHSIDITTNDLSVILPKIRYSKKAKIPSAYTKDYIAYYTSFDLSVNKSSPQR